MKFQRTELIALTKAAMAATEAAAEAAAEKRNAEALKSYNRKRTDYLNETQAAWLEFATIIRKRVRDEVPVSEADIPEAIAGKSWRGAIKTFEAGPPTPEAARTAELGRLLALLESTTDEAVTSSGLREMGFNPASLFVLTKTS